MGAVVAVVVASTGCGEAPAPRVPVDTYLIDDDTCEDATCDGTDIDQNIWQPTPTVTALPEKLMFYGDLSSQAALGPQIVTITNNTMSAVQVTRAYVTNVPDAPTDSGDSKYFSCEPPDLDQPLRRGDTLDVVVAFDRSTEQRDALLVVETSHPDYQSLVVELSGKYFLW